MIAFETLLLGIVIGHGSVRLMVAPPVATVELRLDGAAVATLHGPPWTATGDFGTRPMPHELTAVGYDTTGREVARATQWVNMGRERVKVSALVERDPVTRRPVAVRVAWNTPDAEEPQAVLATLDGAPLTVTDPHRIALPAVDLAATHLVGIEATFADGLRGGADLAFGGEVTDSAENELTAVAVRLPPSSKTPVVAGLAGLFAVEGSPARPLAVDEGRAEVVLVLSRGSRLLVRTSYKELWGGAADPERDRVSMLGTVPTQTIEHGGESRQLFGVSSPVRLSHLGRELQLDVAPAASAPPGAQMIGDALAMAGAEAAGSGHRRAVVLVLAKAELEGLRPGGRLDHSTMGVADVRAYLAALDVPLVVWSLAGKAGVTPSPWGPAEDVSTGHRLRKARAALERELASQRIVWLAGRHLPQRITLDESRTPLRLAR